MASTSISAPATAMDKTVFTMQLPIVMAGTARVTMQFLPMEANKETMRLTPTTEHTISLQS